MQVERDKVEEADQAGPEDRAAAKPAHGQDGLGGEFPLVHDEDGEEHGANGDHGDLLVSLSQNNVLRPLTMLGVCHLREA